MKNVLSPFELWEKLRSLNPSWSDTQPDYEMLHKALLSHKSSADVQVILEAFEHALVQWIDEEVESFMCDLIVEEPYSSEFRQRTPVQRRLMLRELFERLREGV